MNAITRALAAIENGEPQAAARLLPLVYDELRKLAAHKLAQERVGQTLDATALVHEAYLRLVGSEGRQPPLEDASSESAPRQGADAPPTPGPAFDGRGHFFAAAAEAMRRILVENARRKGREKHGGGRAREELHEAALVAPEPREDLLALDEALTRLADADAVAARLVQLRYFAGLSVPQAAEALGVSPRTADRLWVFARAWLHRALHGPEEKPPAGGEGVA